MKNQNRLKKYAVKNLLRFGQIFAIVGVLVFPFVSLAGTFNAEYPDYVVCNNSTYGVGTGIFYYSFIDVDGNYGAIDGPVYMTPNFSDNSMFNLVQFTSSGEWDNEVPSGTDCAGYSLGDLTALGKTGNFNSSLLSSSLEWFIEFGVLFFIFFTVMRFIIKYVGKIL